LASDFPDIKWKVIMEFQKHFITNIHNQAYLLTRHSRNLADVKISEVIKKISEIIGREISFFEALEIVRDPEGKKNVFFSLYRNARGRAYLSQLAATNRDIVYQDLSASHKVIAQ
jgi:hypothetical protein